jgi:uncharacterized protein YjiS (DUF1127 family)
MFTLDHQYGGMSPFTFNWLARIASAIARFWSRRRHERHARLMIAKLQVLDDAMLKDIGIHRCQIESAVLNGEWAEWRPRSPTRLAGGVDTANTSQDACAQLHRKAQQQ